MITLSRSCVADRAACYATQRKPCAVVCVPRYRVDSEQRKRLNLIVFSRGGTTSRSRTVRVHGTVRNGQWNSGGMIYRAADKQMHSRRQMLFSPRYHKVLSTSCKLLSRFAQEVSALREVCSWKRRTFTVRTWLTRISGVVYHCLKKSCDGTHALTSLLLFECCNKTVQELFSSKQPTVMIHLVVCLWSIMWTVSRFEPENAQM